MTVAYTALHRRLKYRDEDTGLYAVAFTDGDVFLSREQQPLYDSAARPIAPREVLPGSRVNVRYVVDERVRRLLAVQVVMEPVVKPPFDPQTDDGHL